MGSLANVSDMTRLLLAIAAKNEQEIIMELLDRVAS